LSKDKLERIKGILEGWKNKELPSDFEALWMIHDTVYPATITQEDIDWVAHSKEQEQK